MMQKQEIVERLSVVKAPKKEGKGNPYVDAINVHMPLLDAMQTVSRKAFKRAFLLNELNGARQGLFDIQKNRLNVIEKNNEKVTNDYLAQTKYQYNLIKKLKNCIILWV